MYQSFYPYFPHYPQSAVTADPLTANSAAPPAVSPPPSSLPPAVNNPPAVGSPTNRSEENEHNRHSPGGTPSKTVNSFKTVHFPRKKSN